MIEYTVKVYDNGDKVWYLNGKRHREDGPAFEGAGGTAYWFLNGILHREGGPAIEGGSGGKAWYLNGVHLTEAEFNQRMNKPCSGKVVEIEGVKYKLVEVV